MICPCCGQTVTPPSRLQSVIATVGPVSATVLRELLAADAPLSGQQLADRVYRGTHDGGPDNPLQVINQTVKALRYRLEPIGWTIRSGRAWGGYALAEVEQLEGVA
jgi:hypothetical protein